MKKQKLKRKFIEWDITHTTLLLHDLLEHKVSKAEKQGFPQVQKVLEKIKSA